ncbi:MAG: hypothetical protein K2K97_05540 [Muribaculaceae bacterium]|nr:hypothetical protein [Muribaculaceae bacterium]
MNTKNNQTVIVRDVKVNASDMILPSTLIFLVLYYPLCLFLSVVGVDNVFVSDIILLMVYALICGGMYAVKRHCTMSNRPMSEVITLINANVGVSGLNWFIVFFAALLAGICIHEGNAILLPAFISIITGLIFNRIHI